MAETAIPAVPMPGSTSLLASSIQQLVRQVQDLTVTAMECGLKDLKMTAGVQHLPGSQVLQPPAPAAYAWQPSLPTSAPTVHAWQSGMAASQGRPWVPASSVAFPGQVPPGFGGAPPAMSGPRPFERPNSAETGTPRCAGSGTDEPATSSARHAIGRPVLMCLESAP